MITIIVGLGGELGMRGLNGWGTNSVDKKEGKGIPDKIEIHGVLKRFSED